MEDLEMSKNRVKPLVIFQFRGKSTWEAANHFEQAAKEAFGSGFLICDESVNIIAFDDRGRLVYPIPPPPKDQE